MQVSADGKGFVKGLGLWFALAIPSTYTNSMLRHLQSKLALHLRTRLSRYTNDLYLSSAPDLRYYRVGPEGGLEGVDQWVTYPLFKGRPRLTTNLGDADTSQPTLPHSANHFPLCSKFNRSP